MLSSLKRSPYYKPLTWILAGLFFTLFLWLGTQFVNDPERPLGPDFVEYWSAGRLNLIGGNPYDPEQLLPIQQETGVIAEQAIIMWNPPMLITLTMLFGLVDFGLSRLVWLVLNVIIIFISVNWIWELYVGKNEHRWLAWIIGFTFVPVLGGLKIGQASALLLLGVAGFLYFMKRDKIWLSGIFISLLLVKPHTLLLFAIAVIFWSIYAKEWRTILGALAAFIIATAVPILFNPNLIGQYLFAIRNYAPIDWATPTIGGLLRLIFGFENYWLQFMPSLLGIIWLIIYWFRNKKTWDWLDRAPLLILVSTLTASFGWTWDLIVCLVAVLQIAVLLVPHRRERIAALILFPYLLIEISALVMRGVQFWSFWLAPALLVFYLSSMKLLRN